ncbi:peptidoglycan DD-metalloendopeptidase Csd1 [Helicobacter acinonychis]|uniref:ToxR-activated protein n=1 Tax=Helicobacter acinonychis (strain Sheeba) TaxID=382638 RepID=Q17YY6_HELAH|nr:peptidoglycan DD-metalloendopeptidase Csd1 [Helicobacter acinonychis]CAJ99140.1 toxR-activated gene [Helicobacter acinonychis str. Sheeba]STP04745.1 putative toxR activated protein [Helicobacter acinonychis]
MFLDRRLIVMVTDSKGSRYINVHILFRQIGLYALLSVVGSLLFLGISLLVLNKEIKNIDQQHALITKEFEKKKETNEKLSLQMDEFLDDLQLSGERINDLEEVVGVNKPEEKEEGDLSSRLDVAGITGLQKSFIMRLIPNDYPLESYRRVSANFSKRIHPILHVLHNHTGLDLSTAINTPVYASASGVVGLANKGWNGGYGNLIKIFHPFGFKTYYAHLNKIAVKTGEFVKKGQLIGYSGNTGMSTGPHLHYEVRFLNQPINPMSFTKWNMKDFEEVFNKERSIRWQSLITIINRLMQKRDQRPSSLKAQK